MAPALDRASWLPSTASWYTGKYMNFLARTVILLGLVVRLHAQALPEPLEPGKPIEREIGNGAVHTYELLASAGFRLNKVVPTPAEFAIIEALPA